MPHYRKWENTLEWITRKWWFFLAFALLQFVTPPYASKGYKLSQDWADVSSQSIWNPMFSFSTWQPVFKIIPFVLVVAIIIRPKIFTRIFNTYVAISYILFVFRQGIGITEKYGLIICTYLFIVFLIVAASWFWEAVICQNDFTIRRQPFWKYWLLPLALLAFWYPFNKHTGMPDFNPAYLFTNLSGLAFCTMTPLYLAVLTFYYPKVNIVTLRITGLAGFIIGLNNMYLNFFIQLRARWWNGVLHIPLVIISLYGLILSLGKTTRHESTI